MGDLSAGRAFHALRWRASGGLVWTQYDDSDAWVAFNPSSADIHLLTDAARTLWSLIEVLPPRTLDELIVAFAAALGRAPDEEFASATRDAVTFMDRAGLIGPDSR